MEFIAYLLPVHLEILETLQSARIHVTEVHSKCNGNFDGWVITRRDKSNRSGKTELVICTETIKRNYSHWQYEINRTLAHESVHVAQSCKEGNGYIERLGFRKDLEEEALAIQDNPREVLRILKKYCL